MEEKQDDLDNLIIKSKKPSGLKKILLAAAVLLLVLILIILVTKSLIQEQKSPTSSVILPPEPVTEQAPSPKEPLFEQVPIEEEKEGGKKIDEVIDRLKKGAPQEREKVEEVETAPLKAAVPEPKSESAEKEKRQPIPKPTLKEPKESKKSAVAKGEYYIQVGAFFRYPPDKKFLESIKKENLNYIIVEGTKSGKPYKKVLVGPYTDKNEARKDLAKVKKRINQNAYITKVK